MHNKIITNKRIIQENEYEFPYHYIPYFKKKGSPSLIRNFPNGLIYLCYQQHVLKKVTLESPDSVLDFGCGDGYFIGSLPSTIPVRIGLDLSAKAIAFAKAFNSKCIFYSNVAELSEVNQKFDIITAIEVIEHIPDGEMNNFFISLYNLLNDTGKIIITAPTKNVPLIEKHFRHYDIDLLEKQVNKSRVGLKIMEVAYLFSKPWWYDIFKKFVSNKFFCLEVKFLMHYVWNKIWKTYRFADKYTGHKIVVVLEKS
ncbi:putative methyltransferase [Desulfosarcina variabilis str. Montpellier]|uniref:class I SAM-dependent methyltransferase n=1 Tax=Desulfosarcina variabilis TaxID=2300 RepID=UPI003AFADAF6